MVGWTKYDTNGKAEAVKIPNEEILVFDVETCVQEGPWPIMATALSPTAWYSWCSPYLIDIDLKPKDYSCLSCDDLIQLGHPLLVIGHNVSYDRARISEQYQLASSRTRFLDTMSLHIAVRGMTSSQRMYKAAEQAGNLEAYHPKWLKETSKNSLADVYKFYFGKSLDKATRDVFVTEALPTVVEQFQGTWLMSSLA